MNYTETLEIAVITHDNLKMDKHKQIRNELCVVNHVDGINSALQRQKTVSNLHIW